MRTERSSDTVEEQPAVTPFDFQPRTRIVFGIDKIEELGRLALELDARRVLVVSDAGVIEAGHTQHGLDALQDAGLDTALFQEFRENPTTEDVERGADLARHGPRTCWSDWAAAVRWISPRASTFCTPTAGGWRTIGAWAKPPCRCCR